MIYAKEKDYTLYQGKMQDVLDTLEENSIDSIVCDPPYELNFMGKGWDNQGIAFQSDTWKHCYRVLKDGGYLLAFGGSRTFHRIACAIEDAGFEIRDTIMWLYGSGFPKSMNIGLAIDKKEGLQGQRGVGGFNVSGLQEQQNRKAKLHIGSTTDGSKKPAYTDYKSDLSKKWSGWGSCLKPAYEPIIVARKPFKGSLVDNVIENGVGGINIDECRVGNEIRFNQPAAPKKESFNHSFDNDYKGEIVNGRFPANVILTHDDTDFDEVCGGMPDTKGFYRPSCKEKRYNQSTNIQFGGGNVFAQYNDYGSSSRYFYCAKASKKDRDEGLDMFEEISTGVLQGGRKEGSAGSIMKNVDGKTRVNPYVGTGTPKKNIHPTVKPIELMQYLVRLVTPKNATILDCFMGSGSTGKAVMFENRERNANYYFIGVEMTEEYLPICKARIDYALNKYEYDFQKQLKEEKDKGQLSIFDFMEN